MQAIDTVSISTEAEEGLSEVDVESELLGTGPEPAEAKAKGKKRARANDSKGTDADQGEPSRTSKQPAQKRTRTVAPAVTGGKDVASQTAAVVAPETTTDSSATHEPSSVAKTPSPLPESIPFLASASLSPWSKRKGLVIVKHEPSGTPFHRIVDEDATRASLLATITRKLGGAEVRQMSYVVGEHSIAVDDEEDFDAMREFALLNHHLAPVVIHAATAAETKAAAPRAKKAAAVNNTVVHQSQAETEKEVSVSGAVLAERTQGDGAKGPSKAAAKRGPQKKADVEKASAAVKKPEKEAKKKVAAKAKKDKVDAAPSGRAVESGDVQVEKETPKAQAAKPSKETDRTAEFCSLCWTGPHHADDCPVIAAGVDSVSKRFEELRDKRFERSDGESLAFGFLLKWLDAYKVPEVGKDQVKGAVASSETMMDDEGSIRMTDSQSTITPTPTETGSKVKPKPKPNAKAKAKEAGKPAKATAKALTAAQDKERSDKSSHGRMQRIQEEREGNGDGESDSGEESDSDASSSPESSSSDEDRDNEAGSESDTDSESEEEEAAKGPPAAPKGKTAGGRAGEATPTSKKPAGQSAAAYGFTPLSKLNPKNIQIKSTSNGKMAKADAVNGKKQANGTATRSDSEAESDSGSGSDSSDDDDVAPTRPAKISLSPTKPNPSIPANKRAGSAVKTAPKPRGRPRKSLLSQMGAE